MWTQDRRGFLRAHEHAFEEFGGVLKVIRQVKRLDSFDWSFNPQIPKQLILELASVRFIPEHGGVLLIGRPAPASRTSASAGLRRD
jgi:hypothetical protein